MKKTRFDVRGHTRKKKKRPRTWRLHLHLFRGDFLLFPSREKKERRKKEREDVGGSRLPQKRCKQSTKIKSNRLSRIRARPNVVVVISEDKKRRVKKERKEDDDAALRDEPPSRGGRARVAERIVERHRVNVIERCVPQKERDIDVVQNVIVVIVVVVVQQGGEEGGEATRRWKIAPERHRGRA
jgi:hypothetical protein